jgi:TrmH family RNA methyltransferase
VALSKADLKYLISLQTKRGRVKEGRFLAEGVRLLESALAAGRRPRVVYYAPSELSPRGQELIRDFGKRGVATASISIRECNRLVDTETGQGIVAVFDTPQTRLTEALARKHRWVLLCDRIADPGNLGTLIRTGAAFGFDLVITTAGSAEAFGPKTIRATMGAIFNSTIVAGMAADEAIAWVKNAGFALYTADIKGQPLAAGMRIPDRAALALGSEAFGADPAVKRAADVPVRIPMASGTESLNVAVAGAILMFWLSSAERIPS